MHGRKERTKEGRRRKEGKRRKKRTHDTTPTRMDAKPAHLNAMRPTNGLHTRRFARNTHQRLARKTLLIEVPDVPRRKGFREGNTDRMMDALEPAGYMRDKRHLRPELRRDLPLVDMVCQAVWYDVIGEVVDVVFGAGFGAGAAVAGDAEDGRLAAEVGKERGDADLRGGGVAAWVGDAGCAGDGWAGDEFGEAVGPVRSEAVVGGEIDDDGDFVLDGVDGFDVGLADTWFRRGQ